MLSGFSLEVISRDGFTCLAAAAWKSTLLLLVAGALAQLLSCRSAALRHLVWTMAFVGALVVPIVDIGLPGWNVVCLINDAEDSAPQVEPALAAHRVQEPPMSPQAIAMLEGPGLEQAIASEERQDSTPAVAHPELGSSFDTVQPHPTRSWQASQIVFSIWLAGASLMIARLAAGFLALKRLEWRSPSGIGHGLAAELALTAREQGIRRPVRLRLSDDPSIPMTWGVWRPVLLLPRTATAWSADPVRVVLLHELAHIARFDYLTQFIGTIVRALNWYNPVAWWGLAHMKVEQEQACDDRVLSAGTAADVYACELLKVTSQFPLPHFTPSAALAISRSARIQHRLESILDESRDRRPLSRRSAGAVALAGVLIISGLAPLHVVSAKEPAASAESATITAELPTAANADGPAAAGPAQAADATKPPSGGQAAAEPAGDSNSSLSAIRSVILKHYVKPTDAKGLDEGAIRGMLQSLNDPYSEFLTPEKLQEVFRHVEGTLSGIGINVAPAETQLNVVAPFPGSPAQAAGIVAGDVILAIDGKTVREFGGTAAIEAIRGKPGTAVSLRILRTSGEEATVNVTRSPIRIQTIRGLWAEKPSLKWNYWLDPQQKLGYVQIAEFNRDTARDCQEVVKGLLAEGLKGLVLDLRGCPGGLLNAAIETANLFLRGGTIVSARGADAAQSQIFTAQEKLYLGDFPLIVIADDRTASAGEILVGALKDNGRSTILGMRTFGKGSVQEVMKIGEAGAIKLTTAHFYTPSGRRIDREKGSESWGIDPTEGYVVTMTPEQQGHRIKQQKTFEQIFDSLRGTSNGGPQAISAAIENVLGDLQLVAAYKCLSARVGAGAAPAGLPSEQAVKDSLAHRERLIKARAEAQKQIEQIDKELSAPRLAR